MADIRGVGKPITFSGEDNPIIQWIDELEGQHIKLKREPRNKEERRLLGRWLGYRGRNELQYVVGAACYAYAHFGAPGAYGVPGDAELDTQWKWALTDHIRTEAGHGWGYIQQANQIDPEIDHSKPDLDFSHEYGVYPPLEHWALQTRDFLSYLIAGNLWPYGHVTATTIQSIKISTPKVMHFEEHVVDAEEKTHHDAVLQMIHDCVWGLIERQGEEGVRRRIAEIDAAALNSGSRITFDPPRRDFLQKYFDVTVENVAKFFEWRRYLYLNVLGWEPEPVFIKNWPKEVPQLSEIAA